MKNKAKVKPATIASKMRLYDESLGKQKKQYLLIVAF